MAFSPDSIANEILRLAKARGDTLSPMKLQKLVYISHGWNLGLLDKPLIDEQVEAWKFGPVIPSLYHEFKRFRMQPITERATSVEIVDGKLKWSTPSMTEEDPESASEAMELIKTVYDNYGQFTAIQLSNATHRPGTPWHDIYEVQFDGDPPKGTDIPIDLIKKHYQDLSNKPAA